MTVKELIRLSIYKFLQNTIYVYSNCSSVQIQSGSNNQYPISSHSIINRCYGIIYNEYGRVTIASDMELFSVCILLNQSESFDWTTQYANYIVGKYLIAIGSLQ